jgi:hypothetical protein
MEQAACTINARLCRRTNLEKDPGVFQVEPVSPLDELALGGAIQLLPTPWQLAIEGRDPNPSSYASDGCGTDGSYLGHAGLATHTRPGWAGIITGHYLESPRVVFCNAFKMLGITK